MNAVFLKTSLDMLLRDAAIPLNAETNNRPIGSKVLQQSPYRADPVPVSNEVKIVYDFLLPSLNLIHSKNALICSFSPGIAS